MTRRSTLLLMLMMAGCISGPPPEEMAAREYSRDSARVEAYEEFQKLERDCARQGGALVVDRNTSPRVPPSTTEMRLATCVISR